jgi:hypothetical protein
MNLMKGDAFQAFMSILGTGLSGKKADRGPNGGQSGGQKAARSSKLHGRLYAVQEGE